ncbi:MAG: hypothetical protein JNM86_04750 [Phycisphaerae bacterium]|nr:hypothetical protein [Phycisphaerae bacterium]MBN8599141.1 hypothetical protein [Planctomycetota bacterium]
MTTPVTKRRSKVRSVLALLVGIALLPSSGCNIIGPAYYFIHGPEKTPAAFTLDKTRSTVVFVDDQNSVLPRRSLRLEIGSAATQLIQTEKLVDDMIDSRGAIVAATRDRDSEPMSVVGVGRAVKAQIVIYVAVDAFSLTGGGVAYSPAARVRVKVLDAENDVRIWPPANLPDGAPLNVNMHEKARNAPTSSAQVAVAENELANEVGVAVAELFFEHEAKRPNRK